MKVLLIVYDNESYISWFPQGLAYIAAVLRNAGHEVVVYQQDINHYPESHLTEYLDNTYFDIVATGACGGYYQYKKLLSNSEAVNKSKRRNKFYYIIGGHISSPHPEYFLLKTGADIAVIGEGEKTVLEIAECIEKAKFLVKNIEGTAVREGTKVTINERRPLITDIDSIPFPAYDLFDIAHYRLLRMPHCSSHDFVMPVLSGRGCTYKCNFCYRMDKGFRPRSPDSIISEIELLKHKYGITYIAFSDELLMSSVKRTTKLCEAFIGAKLNIKWDCNGRLNYATPELLSLMKKAGCVFINYGIEAVDDTVLKNMNKNLTVKQITEGVENTLNSGISPGLNILWGNIGDSPETISKGVQFLLKYDDCAQLRTIRPVTPYPGSPLYYHAVKSGLIKDCEDFYKKHINSDLFTVNFTNVPEEDIYELLLDANMQLIANHFEKKTDSLVDDASDLYLNKNTEFRGFRQS